jgi:type I site-specific restriction-modification system R (restriction) subunit
VVTDRRVLDPQLQNTIKQFEQTEGVVRKIDKDSVQLREALQTSKAIIVTTLQKFPVISATMTDLKGKRFAVIIDEAHSSQSGEAARHLKKTLSAHLDLTEHAIEQKTRIMLDHFLAKTLHAVPGKGRAMVVTHSRLHAVRFYLTFCRVMEEKTLPFKALVAFSGEVTDLDIGMKYTETSLNHLPPRVAIEDAFKTPDYRLLVVANKYQTGFDEPLLHTMYVDKKLDGVQAVQTLSRLNRWQVVALVEDDPDVTSNRDSCRAGGVPQGNGTASACKRSLQLLDSFLQDSIAGLFGV